VSYGFLVAALCTDLPNLFSTSTQGRMWCVVEDLRKKEKLRRGLEERTWREVKRGLARRCAVWSQGLGGRCCGRLGWVPRLFAILLPCTPTLSVLPPALWVHVYVHTRTYMHTNMQTYKFIHTSTNMCMQIWIYWYMLVNMIPCILCMYTMSGCTHLKVWRAALMCGIISRGGCIISRGLRCITSLDFGIYHDMIASW